MKNTKIKIKVTTKQIQEAKELLSDLKKGLYNDITTSITKQNIIKKLGFKTEVKKGEWNGYGYKRLGTGVLVENQTTIPNLIKELQKFIRNNSKKAKAPPKKRSHQDIINSWTKKLSKLTDITLNEALEIANEKKEYKQDKISEIEDRQNERFSSKREKLINKMRRENPLCPIKNKDHAMAILAASNRHNLTHYESYLNEARELAATGDIDKSEIKEYARKKLSQENKLGN